MTAHNHSLDTSLMAPQVNAAAEKYATEHSTPPSPAVSALMEETERTTPVPVMMGGIKEARFLEGLIVATRARRILEIGTFTGATTLAVAEIAPRDAEITTIENDEDVAAIARRHFDNSPHAAKIRLVIGDAPSIVKELPGPFDIVFIDAWKDKYIEYYEALLPKLADTGVMVADNVIWYGLPFNEAAQDPETIGVRDFVAHVQQDARSHNVMLTVGDGLLMIWHAPASDPEQLPA